MMTDRLTENISHNDGATSYRSGATHLEMPELDRDSMAQLITMAQDIFSRYLGVDAPSPIDLGPKLRDRVYFKFGYAEGKLATTHSTSITAKFN